MRMHFNIYTGCKISQHFMDEFAVDLDKVLDEFEQSEGEWNFLAFVSLSVTIIGME